MIVHKINRFLFEYDKAAPKEKMTFEELVKKLSKMTVESVHEYLEGGTLDEDTKQRIEDMIEGGLICDSKTT